MSVRLPLMVLAMILALTIFAPFITALDPMKTDENAQAVPPFQTWAHPLGTDRFGRDVFSRTLYGGRHTLMIAASATLIAIGGGVLLGLGGEMGKWSELVMTILISALLAIPSLLLALMLVTLLGQGTLALLLATGIAQIAPYARMVQGVALSVRSSPYVEGAQAIGAARSRIVLHHILPNIMPTLLAYGGAVFSYCILNSAALSFLGLGGAPGTPDWGVMLADGRAGFRTVWWVSLAPGICITLTVWAVNQLSDSLSHFTHRIFVFRRPITQEG
jgi:peptide/nickel transport system permease protein